jgi:ParB/RepB/Spo0J family partition protein
MNENNLVQKINIALIDEPVNPMRSNAFDDDIIELAKSIKSYGLLQPITLKQKGDRYEVIAGHRRLLAHKYLGLNFIDAIVKDVDDKTSDVLKIEENLRRRDVNPVDEAIFISSFMERNNLSVRETAELLNRSESFINSRINILSYPDYLISYIRDGKISLGAAEYLAQIEPEPLRYDYCRIAALRGLSVMMAKDWLFQSQANRLPQDPNNYQPSPAVDSSEPVYSRYKCVFCHQFDDVINLYNGWFHAECESLYNRALNETSGEVGPEDKNQ